MRTVTVALAAVGVAVLVLAYLSRPAGEALLLLVLVGGLALAYRRVGATDLRDHHEAEWDRVHELSKRAPSGPGAPRRGPGAPAPGAGSPTEPVSRRTSSKIRSGAIVVEDPRPERARTARPGVASTRATR